MRMLEDMVEKKMSSHHLDESKHKGKGTRNLRQKLKYCWTTKSLASIDVLEGTDSSFLLSEIRTGLMELKIMIYIICNRR